MSDKDAIVYLTDDALRVVGVRAKVTDGRVLELRGLGEEEVQITTYGDEQAVPND